jgi:predicted AlkP superfamily phosphohydrolase/phosphomutase
MNILIKALGWGVGSCFLFGELVGIKMTSQNKLKFPFFRNLGFYFFTGICYLIYWGLLYSLFLFFIGSGVDKILNLSSQTITLVYLGLTTAFLSYFLIKWYVSQKERLQIIGGILSGIGIVFVAKIFLMEEIPVVFTLALLFLPAFLASAINAISKEESICLEKMEEQKSLKDTRDIKAYHIDRKLIFIGLDGCDWKLLNTLLQEEKLPNLKKLVTQGVFTRMKSIYPTDSPLIWTSILTGKPPEEHGIIFWYKMKFPCLPPISKQIFYPSDARFGKMVKHLINMGIVKRIPLSTNDRRVKAIWNILTDYDKSSVNIGWIYTWPAEEINGIQVSWYMYPFEYAAQETKRFPSTRLSRRVFPEQLQEEIERFIIKPQQLTKKELKEMYLPSEDIDETRPFADKLSPWDFAKDKTFINIAHYLLDKYRKFDFFSLYIFGIDAVCHSYWPFFPGATNNEKYKSEVLSVSNSPKFQEEAKNFWKAIIRYYEFVDAEVGKLLDRIGPDCNVIIISDHGFKFDGSAHANAPDGIFIAYGPDVNKIELDGVTIYDVLPTILTFLGIPVGKDMKGKILKEIFSDEFLKKYPPRYIETHERSNWRKKTDDTLDKNIISGIEKRLKALGYIE